MVRRGGQSHRPASSTGAAAPKQTIEATAEVILAAGAVNSPQVLQISDVGSPGHLLCARSAVLAG
ncbi:MAG: hypothetical protein E5Y89_02760 [Mesorhizobium sp.]|nr:MAG: hypothetical protein E5Y89_02760 [Mesorhizobium sp.]